MIIDARAMGETGDILCDLCIVGAGVAGITLAREFDGADLRVCVLESGGLEADKDTQALYRGETTGHPYYPLDTARGRQFGGSSNRWLLELGGGRMGGRLRPLSSIDFEQRDWVPHSGWPFDKTHLDAYYERAQAVCAAGPYRYDADYWLQPDGPRPLPVDPAKVETTIYQTIGRETFARRYREDLQQSANITVYLWANALEVETDEAGAVATGVRAATLEGKRFRVRAQVVVLALGGIETPRLLLLSNAVQRNGLGNQHDLVGRFFMEHPHLWSGLIVPAERRLLKEAGLYRVHAAKGSLILGQLSLPEAVLRRERLLNHSVHIVPAPRPRTSVRRPVSTGLRAAHAAAASLVQGDLNAFNRHLSTLFPAVGEFSIAAYRRSIRVLRKLGSLRADEVFLLNHMAEQIPNPSSRVTLSPQARDVFGQPRVHLHWQLDRMDVDSMLRTQRLIDAALREAGLGHLEIAMEEGSVPPDLHGGWHHMGTTRMHSDPRQGVVDAQARVHGMRNLYIAGPSLFPTGGCANPVLTSVALTLRLAAHLQAGVFSARCASRVGAAAQEVRRWA